MPARRPARFRLQAGLLAWSESGRTGVAPAPSPLLSDETGASWFELPPAPSPTRPHPLAAPPPGTAVPMIAVGSVYVLAADEGIDGASSSPSSSFLPTPGDVGGAVALLHALRAGRHQLGPGGRCAATGRLAFYVSQEAAETAGMRGLAQAMVGGGGAPAQPKPPPPPASAPSPTTTRSALVADTTTLPRPPTDALQSRHWRGRATAAAWDGVERRAASERMAAAARGLVAGRGGVGWAGAVASSPPPPPPPTVVAVPLAVALDAAGDADQVWATLNPRLPALPGGGGCGRARCGPLALLRRWGRPQGGDGGISDTPSSMEGPPPARPPPPPPPPVTGAAAAAAAAGAAPAYALPCLSLRLDTPAGPCRFTPLFLDPGELTRAWAGARAAVARRRLADRSTYRAEWRARLERGAVAAFGTGGRLILVEGEDGGASSDEDGPPPQQPPSGGGRDKEDDPPEVREMEALLRSEVAAAAGGTVPPWVRQPPPRKGGARGRPPPWAGAPRPVQVILALTATALTGAISAAARLVETVGDGTDAAVALLVGAEAAFAGLPQSPPAVETTLGQAAAAAAAANADAIEAVAAALEAGLTPPLSAWLGVTGQKRLGGGGGGGLPRLSVAALGPPLAVSGGGGGGGVSAVRLRAPPPTPTPDSPAWEAVVGSVAAGVRHLLEQALLSTIAARLAELGLGGGFAMGSSWTVWGQPASAATAATTGGHQPARRLDPPALQLGDARAWRRRVEAALAEQVASDEPVDPSLGGLAAGLPGRQGDGSGTGLLIIGDVGADGTAGLPWPMPVIAFGDAAALAWVPEGTGESDSEDE